MEGRKLRLSYYYLSICFVIFLSAFPALAQQDPNPNSPTPILISQPDSTRALAIPAEKTRSKSLLQTGAFDLNQKVILYVTNVELLKGEDATAFRVYIQDAKGRQYRLPVLDIQPLTGQEWVYAMTILLRDEIGYWEPPTANGDVLVQVSWRGMISNQVKLGLGKTGGKIEADENAVPTPLKQFAEKPKEPPVSEYVGYKYSGDRKRFLEQATFGPTDELDQRVRRIGLRVWLAEQFQAQYPSAGNPYPNLELKDSSQTLGCPASDPDPRLCRLIYYSMYPLQNWFFKEAFYGEAQLKHKVSWALSQIWVISGNDTQQASHMVTYHQQLSKNAFGNYRDLMKDVTLNPGMGNYLDMVRSTRTSPNENFAREILQLFTIGLFQLNQNGTLKLDSSGEPIPTYTQETVNNFTKVFTGWQFCSNATNPACSSLVTGTVNYKDPMVILSQSRHDVTAKTLLDYTNAVNKNIPAGQTAETDLEQALDNIFYHPNTAPFVSRLLIQNLVTSDPTPAYVGRVSAAFSNNGSGVRGDMKAVIRAILLDPEARGDVKTSTTYGKLREPVQFMTNFMRRFKVRSADGTQQSDGVVAAFGNIMGQNPFYAPTVFNYYSPDYIVPGTSLNAPEFGVLTTSTAIARANVATYFTFLPYPVGRDVPLGTSIDLSGLTELATSDPTGVKLLNALDDKMMHGTMSSAMRGKILTAILAVPANAPEFRAQQAFFLVTSSSQYQIQR